MKILHYTLFFALILLLAQGNVSAKAGNLQELVKSAESGNTLSQFNLGQLYFAGKEVNQNFSLAAKWFEKAADAGSADAQFALGGLYAFGRGVRQSIKRSRYWLTKSAMQGHAEAQFLLAAQYFQATRELSMAWAWADIATSKLNKAYRMKRAIEAQMTRSQMQKAQKVRLNIERNLR